MANTPLKTRPIRFLLVRGLAAALGLGAAGCTVYPSPPSDPAYDTDVLPIFLAHCTRCHDNNLDGGASAAVTAPGVTDPTSLTAGLTLYLRNYGCQNPDGGTPTICTTGAANPRTLGNIGIYIHRTDYLRMPYAPSPPLNDWELKVLDEWLAEKPTPVCSHSANPNPALLCP